MFVAFKKVTITLFIFIFFQQILSNPINDIPLKPNKNLYSFFVEIPSGHKEKWELNNDSGSLELETRRGQKRIINFLPYPGNYGFIPQTLSGDGDPLDLIDLDESSPQGTIKKIKIIGAMYFEDKKQDDYKFIGVSPDGTFKGIQSIEELLLEKPAALEILKLWFMSYKKAGKMTFIRFIGLEESKRILAESHDRWSEAQKG